MSFTELGILVVPYFRCISGGLDGSVILWLARSYTCPILPFQILSMAREEKGEKKLVQYEGSKENEEERAKN